jgi:hypothetical protein
LPSIGAADDPGLQSQLFRDRDRAQDFRGRVGIERDGHRLVEHRLQRRQERIVGRHPHLIGMLAIGLPRPAIPIAVEDRLAELGDRPHERARIARLALRRAELGRHRHVGAHDRVAPRIPRELGEGRPPADDRRRRRAEYQREARLFSWVCRFICDIEQRHAAHLGADPLPADLAHRCHRAGGRVGGGPFVGNRRRRNPKYRVGVDEAGVDREPRRVDDPRIGGSARVAVDRLDPAVAHDHAPLFDGRSVADHNLGIQDCVRLGDARSLGRARG